MKIEMPNLDVLAEGREIFANWSVIGPTESSKKSFLIDSNGLEILEKDVVPADANIAKYLYPVNSMIAFKHKTVSHKTFLVKNDRPQAGTIREDASSPKLNHIELLIDRRLLTHDNYGLGEVMPLSNRLVVNF